MKPLNGVQALPEICYQETTGGCHKLGKLMLTLAKPAASYFSTAVSRQNVCDLRLGNHGVERQQIKAQGT